MNQLHTCTCASAGKRFTDEQIKVLLRGYCQGSINRADIQAVLGIAKTRFFALLKVYQQDPNALSLVYQRATPAKLSAEVEAEIEKELLREKALVEDTRLPISDYNGSL